MTILMTPVLLAFEDINRPNDMVLVASSIK